MLCYIGDIVLSMPASVNFSVLDLKIFKNKKGASNVRIDKRIDIMELWCTSWLYVRNSGSNFVTNIYCVPDVAGGNL